MIISDRKVPKGRYTYLVKVFIKQPVFQKYEYLLNSPTLIVNKFGNPLLLIIIIFLFNLQ